MTNPTLNDIDPKRDLVLERHVPVSPAKVWRAWTEPELLKQWFTPKPWQTIDARIDLRPGGEFYTQMRSPEGEDMPGGSGCYLEVEPEKRLVWTSELGPGYRPSMTDLPFTGFILLAPDNESGTYYTAIARHGDPDISKKHKDMGFYEGWGTVIDQLAELMK